MTHETDGRYTRILLAALTAGFASWIGLNMQSLGFRIGQPNLALDYAMGVLWGFVFTVALLLLAGEARRLLLVAWTAKFIVVLVLMLFYEQNYGLDAYTYFWLPKTGEHWLYPGVDFREDMIPVFKPVYYTGTGSRVSEGVGVSASLGSENTLRFALMVASVTGPFYHAMKVAFAFMGLLGIWFFYRAVVVALGRSCPPMFYLLAFFPSILFWSSILGKDPLQFLFLGLYAYGATRWLVEGRLAASPWIVVGLMGAYLLRPWISIMAGAALFLATLLGRCRPWQTGIMIVVSAPLLLYVGQNTLSMFMGDALNVDAFVDGTMSIARGYASEGATGAKDIDLGSTDAVLASWPVAFFSGLFRPLPFDITNPFTALAAAENTVVLFLALVALVRFRPDYLRDPLILWPLLFTFTWTGIHGFIVLVNFGSGVRYKLQMWPFFLLLLICLTHKEGQKLLALRKAVWKNRFRPLNRKYSLEQHFPGSMGVAKEGVE